MENTEEINELADSNNNDFGHYVAAFFVATGDRYLRPSRGQNGLGFFNRSGYLNDIPQAPSYLMVLYQRPGSSDFSIHLIPAGYNRYGGECRPGGLGDRLFSEQDPMDYRKSITRHVWALDNDRPSPARFFVKIDGQSIALSIRDNDRLFRSAMYNNPREGEVPAWKYNGEADLGLSIQKTDRDGKAWVIPSKAEMLSGKAFPDADFFSIEFSNISLRACNLPNANFTNAKLSNVNFDRSELAGARFSTCSRPNEQEPNYLRSCSFTDINLNDAVFEGATLDDCTFLRADLTGANFTRARLANNTSFERANLTRTNFSEVDFSNFRNLAQVSLVRASGKETILRKATLPYTFLQTNWKYLDLSETKFTGTFPAGIIDATGVIMKNSKWAGANFTGANFTGAKLNGADFTGATLANANFTDADLSGADFTGAILTGANFSGTILASTILNKANLTGVVFSTPPKFGRSVDTRTRMHETIVHISLLGTDWSYLDLTSVKFTTNDAPPKPLKADYIILDNVNFHLADLKDANFEFAQLRKVQFSSAILRNAKMNSAILIGGTFTNANMWGTKLDNADLTSAKFEGVDLFNASVKGATLVNTWFNDAYLANMDFSDIKGKSLQGCNFSYACLVNAKFNNTKIGAFGDQSTSFANACLHGAEFKSAELMGVNLTDAFIATQGGTLKATIRAMEGEQLLTYDPTKIQDKATNVQTICPNGTSGPCTVPQMKSSKTNTNTWTHKKTIQETVA